MSQSDSKSALVGLGVGVGLGALLGFVLSKFRHEKKTLSGPSLQAQPSIIAINETTDVVEFVGSVPQKNAGPVYFMIGDIGGTNSRLALYQINADGDQEKLISRKTYPSQAYNSLLEIIQTFMTESGDYKCSAIALGVAGPVIHNTSRITNVKWFVDGNDITEKLGVPTTLINDFGAVALGCLALKPEDLLVINDTKPVPKAPIACLGAGTGLGEAYLTHNGTEYDVWASEGGHTDFAPRNAEEFKLMEKIFEDVKKKVERRMSASGHSTSSVCSSPSNCGPHLTESEAREAEFPLPVTFVRDVANIRVSVERIVAGPALKTIYDFLAEEYPHLENKEVTEELKKNDPGVVIGGKALRKEDELCSKSVHIFIGAYGAEAGNLALKTLPFGGMFLAGGIAPKLFPLMKEDKLFYHNMINKGRLGPLVATIPVYVIKGNVEVGMLGVGILARRMLRSLGFVVTLNCAPSVQGNQECL